MEKRAHRVVQPPYLHGFDFAHQSLRNNKNFSFLWVLRVLNDRLHSMWNELDVVLFTFSGVNRFIPMNNQNISLIECLNIAGSVCSIIALVLVTVDHFTLRSGFTIGFGIIGLIGTMGIIIHWGHRVYITKIGSMFFGWKILIISAYVLLLIITSCLVGMFYYFLSECVLDMIISMFVCI